MQPSILRVAVCQLECHPAVTVGDVDYESEPVLPSRNNPTLSEMARHSLDVSGLQRRCKSLYRNWQRQRIEGALNCLAQSKPIPQVIVFPEGSLPLEILPMVRDFAVTHNVAVFGGTHPFHRTQENAKLYRTLGIDPRQHKEWADVFGADLAVMPIFSGRASHFHLKTLPAIFERSDVSNRVRGTGQIDVVPIRIGDRTLSILPLVCSEALQQHAATSPPDLVVIASYDRDPDHFDAPIRRYVDNGVPTLICNDGAFGGSGVHVVMDQRAQSWWWEAPNNGRLPQGDGLLVVDLNLNALAPQVGVMNPQLSASLVSLTAVVAEDGKPSLFAVSNALEQIRTRDDLATREILLTECIEKREPTPIQLVKLLQLKRLSAVGNPGESWWDTLGRDCIIRRGPDIRGLEAGLASECVNGLQKILDGANDLDYTVVGKLHALTRRCREIAATAANPIALRSSDGGDSASAVVDREDDVKSLLDFINNADRTVFVTTGIDGIGKSRFIRAGLERAGHTGYGEIVLTPDSSLEFIGETICKLVGYPRAGDDRGVKEIIASDAFLDRMPRGDVIVITGAENLISFGQWRDPGTVKFFQVLARQVEKARGKVIIESAVRLQLDEFDVPKIRRWSLKGLDSEDGALLLDQHLRRAGLNPNDFEKKDRVLVSGLLAGHPGAIILASEYIEQFGMQEVLQDLQRRSGIHAQIVRQILRRIPFTETEKRILSLLNVVRVAIPPQILNEFVEGNAVSASFDLVQRSVLDRVGDHVTLSGLIRGFADLPVLSDEEAARLHAKLASHFGNMAGLTADSNSLRFAVESQYHAAQSGKPELAYQTGNLVDGLVGAVRQLIAREKETEAKPIVDQLLQSHKSAEIFDLAALVYARLGHVEEALALAKEAVALQPTRIWILTEVGRRALHVHRDEIAADAIKIAKAVGQDSGYIATLEGRIHLKRGEVKEAMESFQRAVVLAHADKFPDAWAHYYYGRELLKVSEISEAIRILYDGESLESRRLHPRRHLLVLLRTQLGLAYTLGGDIKQAEQYFKLVMDEDPGNAEVARTFAFFRAAQGSTDAALKALDDLNPSTATNRYDRCQAHLFRGLFLLNLGYKERASAEFGSAHQADPRNVFVLLRWADTLFDMAGDLSAEREHEPARYCAEQAKSVAEKILEFDRDNEKARQILERVADKFHVM